MAQQDNAGIGEKALRALQSLASADNTMLLKDLLEETYRKHAHTGASVWGVRAEEGVARTPSGVLVNSKDQVMKVYMDADRNYSVSGYNERLSKCFGSIYLGLDKGAEYDRQATKVNQAIGRLTAPDAFALALQETRNALAALPGGDDEDISVRVLARICTRWFDLPDDINVVEGRMFPHFDPPPKCPGDYAFPSGFTFKPEPEKLLTIAGPVAGNLLKTAVVRFVADLRAANRLPASPIARAIFDAFPNGEDDLIARTIIGVMMGMLPTVSLNLMNIMGAWRADGGKIFSQLQAALKQQRGGDPYVRASNVLKKPLMQAMQGNPVPDAVWRTAVRDHTLGTKNPVQVKAGDKVFVSIVSATREDLDAGVTDVFPVFGGDRKPTPHPTHACPGYEAAIGVMLGFVNGLLEPT